MQFIDRVGRWYREALAKLKTRSWKAWLVVVALGYVVLEVVRAFVTDAGTLILVWGFQGFQWVASQPMGMGGVAILVYILVLVGISWWQTRPRKAPPIDSPSPISDEELRLIQDIRAVWKRHGRLAIEQLREILAEATYNLGREAFWSELLGPVMNDLGHARQAFESALDSKEEYGVEVVRGTFNEMYAAYVKAMRWVAILQSRELLEIGDQSDRRLNVWRQNHRDMVNRLHDLDTDPRHHQTLKIFMPWVDNPEFRTFLTEAEMSPEWLALIHESKARVTAAQ